MACAQKNPLPLIGSKDLEGERGSTYWCMLVILCSLFSFVISNSSFLFPLFLSHFLLQCCDSLLEVTITAIVIPPLCTARVLYIMPVVTGFYYFSL